MKQELKLIFIYGNHNKLNNNLSVDNFKTVIVKLNSVKLFLLDRFQ